MKKVCKKAKIYMNRIICIEASIWSLEANLLNYEEQSLNERNR